MNENPIKARKNYSFKISIILLIITLVFSIISPFFIKSTTTSYIGIEGIKLIKERLFFRLTTYGLACVLFGVITFLFYIKYGFVLFKRKSNTVKSNVLVLCIVIFIVLLLIDKYDSNFESYNFSAGNRNFFGIEYFEDLKFLLKCKKDIKEEKTYTVNCDDIKLDVIYNTNTYSHKGNVHKIKRKEYQVSLYTVDKNTGEYNILQKVYVSKNDIQYIKQFEEYQYVSGFTVNVYENTKLLKSIEPNRKEIDISNINEEDIIAVDLTRENYDMMGIKKKGRVVLPEVFEKDGKYYRITNIKLNEIPRQITELTIPSSVKNIEIDGNIFFENVSLKYIVVCSDNEYYSSEDGILFDKEKTKLIYVPNEIEKDHYDIPNGVLEIGKNAFYKNVNLKSVNIPNSVSTIGIGAFSDSYIESVNISEGVTKIDNMAFSNCTNLTSITIPKSVEKMGKNVFIGCKRLSTINFKRK